MRFWIFGNPEGIRILGVDPDFQRRGIGRKLGEALLKHFERRGINGHFASLLMQRQQKEEISFLLLTRLLKPE